MVHVEDDQVEGVIGVDVSGRESALTASSAARH